jgi:hypothetical protein
MSINLQETPFLVTVPRLSQSLRKAAKDLSASEARYLIDIYYQIQETRKAVGNQASALAKSEEPNEFHVYLRDNLELLEDQIKACMKNYSSSTSVGEWAMAQLGIGPVLSAALLAHIDPEKTQSATHIYKDAGLAPGQRKKKGEKLDFNPALKRICWLIGESFVKVSRKPIRGSEPIHFRKPDCLSEPYDPRNYPRIVSESLLVRQPDSVNVFYSI